jgi:aspartate aminotransferase
MPFIRKIEEEIVSNPNLNHEYLWFLGMDKFNEVAPRLILGEQSPALLEERVSGYETGCSCAKPNSYILS